MSIISIIFLSQDEIKELTDLKIPKAQIRWLTKHAFPFEISAAGKPKVLRSVVIQRMTNKIQLSNQSEPNYDAIS